MNRWRVWSHGDGHGPNQVFKRSVLHSLYRCCISIDCVSLFFKKKNRFERQWQYFSTVEGLFLTTKGVWNGAHHPMLFLKEMSCHDYTTLTLEIMMKPYCNPVKHSNNHFQKWQLVWHGVTCHSKRHGVLCASELLIIYGFIVCVVWVTDYCWYCFCSNKLLLGSTWY